MENNKLYVLPQLSYGYKDLEPYISEQQLILHHQKHHQAYVNGANAIFEKLEKARKDGIDLDIKSILKELSFHIGGHVLHSAFWNNLAPASDGRLRSDELRRTEGGGGEPRDELREAILNEYGDFERFKKEFTQAAVSTEGSGWAVLTYDKETGKLLIMQIEKHNLNVFPGIPILMALDLWEHAYYLDYKNERAKFVEAFWSIVDWSEVAKRLKKERI